VLRYTYHPQYHLSFLEYKAAKPGNDLQELPRIKRDEAFSSFPAHVSCYVAYAEESLCRSSFMIWIISVEAQKQLWRFHAESWVAKNSDCTESDPVVSVEYDSARNWVRRVSVGVLIAECLHRKHSLTLTHSLAHYTSKTQVTVLCSESLTPWRLSETSYSIMLHFSIVLHCIDLTSRAFVPSMFNVIHCSVFLFLYWTLHVSA
jgi:hypothetical protein